MAAVVVASNYLVQFPVHIRIGNIDLADLLTWGAFTYPAAFLVTDLTNRRFGPVAARRVVYVGFAVAVLLSILLASPRIAIASGTAFLIAQTLDVFVFDRLRGGGPWWRAPLASSVLGSLVDTGLFFTLAFAAAFVFLGPNDPFAIETAPLMAIGPFDVPRWMSWAVGDLAVKLLVAAALLVPYRLAMGFIPSRTEGGQAA
ncbi:MAG: VUT family protein [Pseudomonadota bacterium]